MIHKGTLATIVLAIAGSAGQVVLNLKSEGPAGSAKPIQPFSSVTSSLAPLATRSPCETIQDFVHSGNRGEQAHELDGTLSIKASSRLLKQFNFQADFKVNAETLSTPCIPRDPHLAFVIVTIPDPISTHLSLNFDQMVESIQRAAQAVGYQFDRYYFPWETEVASDEPDLDKRMKKEQERQKQLREPGVLLFRGDRGDPNLAIFLVMETPTSGINRTAFANTITYIAPTSKQIIPILGPTFSGSFKSLTDAITEAKGDASLQFDIITGTATASQPREEFMALGLERGWTFGAVQHNEKIRVRTLRDHLSSELAKQGGIAWLVEDETAYGGGFVDPNLEDIGSRDLTGAREGDLVIPFPREISRLRNAYEELPGLRDAPGSKANETVRQTLPFDLRTPVGRDSVPEFARGQTPIVQEAILMDIASTLRRDRIRFVVIVATDVLDSIFIGRYLKSASPDIRLISQNTDRLFVSASAYFPLTGSLAVSTYPLIGINQAWTKTRSQQNLYIPFASEPAQGAYNACRALLVRMRERAEQQVESWQKELVEFKSPGDCKTKDCNVPPVWISVVSRTGYWPVAVIDSSTDYFATERDLLTWSTDRPRTLSPEFEIKSPGRIWIIMFLGLSGLLTVFAALACVANISILELPSEVRVPAYPPRMFTGRFLRDVLWQVSDMQQKRWLASIWLKPREAGSMGRAFYLLTAILCLLAFYLTASAPLWRLHPVTPERLYRIFIGLSISTVLLLSLAAIFPLLILVQSRGRYYGWLGVVSVVAFLGFVGSLGKEFFLIKPHHEDLFFAYRALDPASGVSPSLPFFFVICGIFCWSWVHLKRLIIYAERRPLLPEFGAILPGEASFARTSRDLERQVKRVVHSAFFEKWRTVASFLVFCFVVIALREYLQSFESKNYDLLYCSGLGLLLSLIFLTWSRFLRIWWSLRQLLEQLERHPFRASFSTLSPAQSWSPLLQRGIMRRTYKFETQSVANLLLRTSVLPLPSRMSGQFPQLRMRVDKLLAIIGKGDRLPISQTNQVYVMLKQMAVSLRYEILDTLWEKGWSESLEGVKEKEKKLYVFRGPVPETLPEPTVTAALLASECFSLPYVFYIRFTLLQLKNLLFFVTAGFVLAVLSINSYPFQSHHLLGWTMGVILGVLGTGVAMVFAQMDRDAILSRITDTQPGKIEKSFAIKMLSYGALPVLTLVSAQFPSVSRFLFSWIQPAIEALR